MAAQAISVVCSLNAQSSTRVCTTSSLPSAVCSLKNSRHESAYNTSFQRLYHIA